MVDPYTHKGYHVIARSWPGMEGDIADTMSAEESLAFYERYAAPGPGRVLFQAALANFNPHAATRVDFDNDDRAPLLLIAGGADHVVPAAVDQETAKHYARSKAVTEY
jgi:alpha-beta hydrolase superfamily lysophospholipase